VIKQADVVLAMFLLGDAFSAEEKKRNFEFYDPLTTGDSSLSSCVEAIIAAQVGDIGKAIRYGVAALLTDLADVGGNVKDGCHIASMGGTWMMLTYGLGQVLRRCRASRGRCGFVETDASLDEFGPHFVGVPAPGLLHDVEDVRAAMRESARPNGLLQGRIVIWSCKDKSR
jgi:hypothetical protein